MRSEPSIRRAVRLQNVSMTAVDFRVLAKTHADLEEAMIALNQKQLAPEVTRHQ
jgi:hypothetical protein